MNTMDVGDAVQVIAGARIGQDGRIVRIKFAFGRRRYLVRPIDEEGSARWFSADDIRPLDNHERTTP